MNSTEMNVLFEKIEDRFVVHSPTVGYVRDLPLPGEIVIGGSCIGSLQVISTMFRLRLPEGVSGKVVGSDYNEKVWPVAYRENLFTLVPIAEEVALERHPEEKESRKSCEGKWVVPSPTDGIFYRRSSPDSPCYVELGSIVKSGQVLGLVEVMKCFNQILFVGPGFPEQAKIVELCVEDAREVKYRQPLFLLE